MVSAEAPLRIAGAAEFAAPDHERGIEQPARFQIGEQCRGRLVGRRGTRTVVFLDVVVAVPGNVTYRTITAGAPAGKNLDVAHAPFDQSPGDEALAGKWISVLVPDAVKLFGLLAFSLEIEGFGSGGLHSVGEFEAVDTRSEVGLRGAGLRVGAVQIPQKIERGPLLVVGLVLDPQDVVDGFPPSRIKRQRLVGLWEESRGPDLIVSAGSLTVHHDKRREVLIFGSQSVGDPGPGARTPGNIGSAHQLDRSGCMVVPFDIAGVEESHVIHMPCKVRQNIGHPGAALPVLLPAEWRSQTFSAGREKPGFRIAARQDLAVARLQLRLVVPCIHLGRSAGHEKPDDSLRSWGEVRAAGKQRVDGTASAGGAGLFVQHRRKREGSESVADLLEELAARGKTEFPWGVMAKHGGCGMKRNGRILTLRCRGIRKVPRKKTGRKRTVSLSHHSAPLSRKWSLGAWS